MENPDKQWKTIYKIGAVTTIIVLCGIILDMVVGTITGGNISELPQTAIERFSQFKENGLLGLWKNKVVALTGEFGILIAGFMIYIIATAPRKA